MADGQRTSQASLGCGTLILIALIVMIFSGRGASELEREVQGLRSEINELKKSVDAQSNELKMLRQKLDKKPGIGDAAKDK
jgi:Sec-independent protein translocase protein TatA